MATRCRLPSCSAFAVLLVRAVCAADTESDDSHGSTHGHSSADLNQCYINDSGCTLPIPDLTNRCRYEPLDEMKEYMRAGGCTERLLEETISASCNAVCPSPSAPDVIHHCARRALRALRATHWRTAQSALLAFGALRRACGAQRPPFAARLQACRTPHTPVTVSGKRSWRRAAACSGSSSSSSSPSPSAPS